MEDYQAAEETAFVVDEVSNIVKEAIESAIGGNAYQHSKVNQWTTNVVEQTLSQLTKLGKPFKYIVTCVIMQKNGAGLHTASSCFWDSSTDGMIFIHVCEVLLCEICDWTFLFFECNVCLSTF
ncbi:dynein light chain Tctex-type 1 isoform X1 [Macaca thibetana thibetana]|uniref:dynein light chain Tctex-type 1 isoform X1 n=1 Tax=Macaca thibetana thibetana TaxID=257877 RepID=UPI0021BCDD6F|nr:dynein light chain Tctex-type 1 isoform X1 [Macaca thibetana thibetana]